MGTPIDTPRAPDATAAAATLRELIHPSSEDGSHSSLNDLLLNQDAAALLARVSAGAGAALALANLARPHRTPFSLHSDCDLDINVETLLGLFAGSSSLRM